MHAKHHTDKKLARYSFCQSNCRRKHKSAKLQI